MMLENLSTGQTRMALQVKSIEGQVQAVSTGMGSLVSTQKGTPVVLESLLRDSRVSVTNDP